MKYRRVRAPAFLLLLALLASAPPRVWAAVPPPRIALWIEPSANLPTIASRERIIAMLDRAKAAGVTDIIPEAKNAWGYVIYESTFAPHIRTLRVGRTMAPVYPPPAEWFPGDLDPLGVIVTEAHARGIRVHAAVNVFGEGLNAAKSGPLFERPQWQAQHLGPDGKLIPATEVGTIGFANPVNPEVQLYELAVLREIVSGYDVDGIVLDRARFPDVTADFSDLSRHEFETWLGRPVEGWPQDILTPNGAQVRQGPLFPQWTAWRASIIQKFVRAAESVVHGTKPAVAFSAYVGGWYPMYWNEGVNWAAAKTTPSLPWITEEWRQASVAEMYDFLMIGLYYTPIRYFEAVNQGSSAWMSVEGGALMANELVGGATAPVPSLLLSLYEGQPDRFRAAVETSLAMLGSVMLFDLSYLERFDWWSVLQTAVASP
jgi:uncharacterized lipoprotein YddW (UPF0748 family)